jgi:polar amino acid transport system ATP-binding protein
LIQKNLIQTKPIQLKDMTLSQGNVLLRDVSCTFLPGQVTVLMGVSGSGKTTLLEALCGEKKLATGEIFINQRAVQPGKAMEDVALLSQKPCLFPHMTLLQNLTLAPIQVYKTSKKQAESEALQSLKEFGLEGKAHCYPDTLSGGESQRVALARLILLKPDVLLLDEPTTALDKGWVLELTTMLRTLANQGKTVVLVTHDYVFARTVGDQILMLSEQQLHPITLDSLQDASLASPNSN